MNDAIYSFRAGPSYRGASRQELFDSAMDQPMGFGATLLDQAKGGVLESFGLGTAIRESQLPEEAPTAPGIVVEGEDGSTVVAPDTPQMRRRRTIWGDPANVQPETPDQFRARRNDAGALSEDAYKASPYFREDIPWDAGMTEDRAAALATMQDAKRVREFYASKRPIAAFLGNLAGQAVDPINYIPVAGPVVKAAAVARLGKIGGAALASALDAAGNTAIFGIGTAGMRAKFGDDVSWQATVSQIATAALIGGAFGAIGGALGRRAEVKVRPEIEERLATLRNTQEARVALNEAIDGLARGEDVTLSPNTTGALSRIATEVDSLSRAYDQVRAEPTGPARDPLVAILPEDIEGVLVGRGSFRNVNEADVSSRSGWGLVKIIWRHGDESSEPEGLRVTKADVIDLPNVIRQYEPSSVAADGRAREWRVERDGRTVVYADALMPEGRHVVTAYVQNPKHIDANKPLSEKRKPVAASSSSDVFSAVGDTAQALSLRDPDGRLLPARGNIPQLPAVDNSAPPPEPRPDGVAQAETAIARPDDTKALASQYRVDPATGAFTEEAEIAQLASEGRLTEEDAAALADADSAFETGSAFAEALKSAASCLI